jgi:uncharacterized caspase-like protein
MTIQLLTRRAALAQGLALGLAPGMTLANEGSRRVALVIGNGAYPTAPLKNPVADARAVSQELSKLGFAVTTLEDKTARAMTDAVVDFIQSTQNADLRWLYYAGHGAQIRGRNLLVPVDAGFESEEELARKSLDLAEVVERMGRQTKVVNVFVVDACRDNPATNAALSANGRQIKFRGAAKGLAPVATPRGSLIAYSTAPGQVADDSVKNKNSLYARHLLANMTQPGITLEELFKRVRNGVLTESQNRQQPWEQSSLTGDYCLRSAASSRCQNLG